VSGARAAHRPGAVTALRGPDLLGDRDLLCLRGLVRVRRVLTAAVRVPGALRELQAAVVAVARVGRPVAAGLALGDPVPGAGVAGGRVGRGRRRPAGPGGPPGPG